MVSRRPPKQFQLTAGAGPCLHAHRTGTPVAAGPAELARRWPTFADQLLQQSPVRAVLAVPLTQPLVSGGALDCYLADEADLTADLLAGAAAAAARITSALMLTFARYDVTADDGGSGYAGEAGLYAGPEWLHGPEAARRSRVAIACGILDVAFGLNAADALAVLRGRAFATSRTVDDIAGDLVDGRITSQDFKLTGD